METEVRSAVTKPTEESIRHFIDIIYNTSHKLKAISEIFNDSDESSSSKDSKTNPNDSKYKDLFTLCNDQILKCASLMADIYKDEIAEGNIAEESRQFVLDRIVWCFKKVDDIYLHLCGNEVGHDNLKDHVTSMECDVKNETLDFQKLIKESFISWVDDALKLFDVIQTLFNQDSDSLKKSNRLKLQNECSSTLLSFHKVVRELVFSAMDICQNCLSDDRRIINARCHVVLRESKNLLSEILFEPKFLVGEVQDLDANDLKIKQNLHYPTIRMFNDILRDAVCSLETSMNKAVLGLVLKCLMDPSELLQKMLSHKDEDKAENLISIKEFDTHNEQIIQIGLFAISCSADEQRVLQLKSCLASLEILEAHLIPAIFSNSNRKYAQFLVDHWIQEVRVLRTAVYLIIDPSAFIDLVIEKYYSEIKLLQKGKALDSSSVQYLIHLGECVYDYVNTYFVYEPQIFEDNKTLPSIVTDLRKVIKECKAVKNIFLMDSKALLIDKEANHDKIMKRLKLLYNVLSKITKELANDNENPDDETFADDDLETSTNQCREVNSETFIKTDIKKGKGLFKVFDIFKGSIKNETEVLPDKLALAKSKNFNKTYMRTTIIRSVPNMRQKQSLFETSPSETLKPILKRLETVEYRRNVTLYDVISASGIFDESNDAFMLANVSDSYLNDDSIREANDSKLKSIFYSEKQSAKQSNKSLRRKVLVSQAKEVNKKLSVTNNLAERTIDSLNNSLDFHITDILEQLSGLSDTMSLLKIGNTPAKKMLKSKSQLHLNCSNKKLFDIDIDSPKNGNVLTLKINENAIITPKKAWNIKINNDNVDKENVDVQKVDKNTTPVNANVDCDIDMSFGSDIPTPERINDIHLLEQKLAKLKEFWQK